MEECPEQEEGGELEVVFEVLWFGRLAKQYGTLRCLNFVRCVRVGGSGPDTRVKFDVMVSLSLLLNRKIREV